MPHVAEHTEKDPFALDFGAAPTAPDPFAMDFGVGQGRTEQRFVPENNSEVTMPVGSSESYAARESKEFIEGVKNEDLWGNTSLGDLVGAPGGLTDIFINRDLLKFPGGLARDAVETATGFLRETVLLALEDRPTETFAGQELEPFPDPLLSVWIRSNPELAQRFGEKMLDLQDANEDFLIRNGLLFGPDDKPTILGNAMAQGGTSFSALGLALFFRNPALAAGLFGFIQQVSGFQEAEEAGKTPSEAADIGTLQGAIEAGVSLVGVSKLTRIIGSKSAGIVTKIIASMVTEGIEEGVTEALIIAVQNATGVKDISLGEALIQIFQAVFYGAIIGGGTTGTITTTQAVVRRIAGDNISEGDVGKIAGIMDAVSGETAVEMAEEAIDDVNTELEIDRDNASEQPVTKAAKATKKQQDRVVEIIQRFNEGEPFDVRAELDKILPETRIQREKQRLEEDRRASGKALSKQAIKEKVAELQTEIQIAEQNDDPIKAAFLFEEIERIRQVTIEDVNVREAREELEAEGTFLPGSPLFDDAIERIDDVLIPLRAGVSLGRTLQEDETARLQKSLTKLVKRLGKKRKGEPALIEEADQRRLQEKVTGANTVASFERIRGEILSLGRKAAFRKFKRDRRTAIDKTIKKTAEVEKGVLDPDSQNAVDSMNNMMKGREKASEVKALAKQKRGASEGEIPDLTEVVEKAREETGAQVEDIDEAVIDELADVDESVSGRAIDRSDLLPEGWTLEVGRTDTKEGHTFEAQVDWPNRRIVFSTQEHLDNFLIKNHEIAHVIIETSEQSKALFEAYIEFKKDSSEWKKPGADWIVKNNFHREEIAVELGEHLTGQQIPSELQKIFEKFIPEITNVPQVKPRPVPVVKDEKSEEEKRRIKTTRIQQIADFNAEQSERIQDDMGHGIPAEGVVLQVRYLDILNDKQKATPQQIASFEDDLNAFIETGKGRATVADAKDQELINATRRQGLSNEIKDFRADIRNSTLVSASETVDFFLRTHNTVVRMLGLQGTVFDLFNEEVIWRRELQLRREDMRALAERVAPDGRGAKYLSELQGKTANVIDVPREGHTAETGGDQSDRLQWTRGQLISAAMLLEQENIAKQIRDPDGEMAWTDKLVRMIDERLTDQDRDFIAGLFEMYSQSYERFNTAYRAIYNRDLTRVEFYSHIAREGKDGQDKSAHTETVLIDSLAVPATEGEGESLIFPKGKPREAISRVDASSEIKILNVVEVFDNYNYDVEHFIAMGKKLSLQDKLLREKEFSKHLREILGRGGFNNFIEHVKIIARSNQRAKHADQAFRDLFEWFRGNFFKKTLLSNPKIGLGQMASVLAGKAGVPTQNFIGSVIDYSTSPKKVNAFLNRHPTFSSRELNFNPEIDQVGEFNKLLKFLNLPSRKGDGWAVRASAWAQIQQMMRDGVSEEEALNRGAAFAEGSQQSTLLTQRTLAQKSDNPYVRSMTMFTSSPTAMVNVSIVSIVEYRQADKSTPKKESAAYWKMIDVLAIQNLYIPALYSFITGKGFVTLVGGSLGGAPIVGGALTTLGTIFLNVLGDDERVFTEGILDNIPLSRFTRDVYRAANRLSKGDLSIETWLTVTVPIAEALSGLPVDNAIDMTQGARELFGTDDPLDATLQTLNYGDAERERTIKRLDILTGGDSASRSGKIPTIGKSGL